MSADGDTLARLLVQAGRLTRYQAAAAVQGKAKNLVFDEYVILDPVPGVYYGLNQTGARIWELVDGTRTVEQIRDVIVEEYEVSLREAEKDLVELLGQLQHIGALINS